jgi:hypothetical protein
MDLKHTIKRVLREEESKDDMSPMITDLLNNIVVNDNEDVCKVEVTAPWNRETISGGDYKSYKVNVYFIGGYGSKNWPRTEAVKDKEENIMNEIWDTVYNFMGIGTDLYSSTVKNCNENIQESTNKDGDEKIRRYILRRVPWHEILEGLDDGIKLADARYEMYNNEDSMSLSRYTYLVMAVLMDHILLFLKDEVSQEIIHYGATENYLSKLFADEIFKSYNRITD